MGLALFKRNLAKHGKPVALQNRDIVAPVAGSTDFDENFTDKGLPVQALISTERGKVLFDGVSTDQKITHKICIEFVTGVTAETWILFSSRRFDILDVENVGEQDICLVLRCNERGTGEAAKA